MRSRRNQLPAVEVIRVSWIVDTDPAVGRLTGATDIVLSERLLKECIRCGDDGKKPAADR